MNVPAEIDYFNRLLSERRRPCQDGAALMLAEHVKGMRRMRVSGEMGGQFVRRILERKGFGWLPSGVN